MILSKRYIRYHTKWVGCGTGTSTSRLLYIAPNIFLFVGHKGELHLPKPFIFVAMRKIININITASGKSENNVPPLQTHLTTRMAASKFFLTSGPYSWVFTTITDPLLTLSAGKPLRSSATSL